MLRRWNFTIIVIVTAFVLGIVVGYIYRDQFVHGSLLPWKLASTQADVSGAILQADVEKILTPKTTTDAVTQAAEVYAFTGYVRSIAQASIVVDHPDDTTPEDDAIQFTLTSATKYSEIESIINGDGLPDSSSTDLVQTDIKVNDIVTVYTAEDMRHAEVRTVTAVQRIKDNSQTTNQ